MTMILECFILLPTSPEGDAALQRQVMEKKNKLDGFCHVRLLQCRPDMPGCVWRGLYPVLLQSSKCIAKRALEAQFKLVGMPPNFLIARDDNDQQEQEQNPMTILQELDEFVKWRRVRLFLGDATNQLTRSKPIDPVETVHYYFIIWIQPPSYTFYQTDFSRTLIAWEHTMILYQSLAAWISTLGGGYFYCRHMKTAVALARQQRQIAFLMGDYNMAYKCTINEAYGYIYAGKFSTALQTIDYIDVLHKRVDTQAKLDTTIRSMCQSARLFCMRVRKASKKLKASPKHQPARTFDDYLRIRVIQ